MLCAACGEETEHDPCAACGASALVDGRFRLEAVLGHGAAGTTFRAVDLEGGEIVAAKEIPLHRAVGAKELELVHREARVLAQLSHPGIPRFVDSRVTGVGRGRALWLVQELVDGVTLAEELATRRYTEREVCAVLDELLGVLRYLHGLSPPVVHRDLKPGNVMRRRAGGLVLVDFGAVRDALKDTKLGGSTVAGTFGYMAPEQLRGDATPATDLYGLGALAVALLTRVEPHSLLDGGRLRWRGHAVLTAPMEDLLERLLAAEPTRRADPQEVRRRLDALLGRGAAPPPRPRELVSPPADGAKGGVRLAVRERSTVFEPDVPQWPSLAGVAHQLQVAEKDQRRATFLKLAVLSAAITVLLVTLVLLSLVTAGPGAASTASPVAEGPPGFGEPGSQEELELQRALGRAPASAAGGGKRWTVDDDIGVRIVDVPRVIGWTETEVARVNELLLLSILDCRASEAVHLPAYSRSRFVVEWSRNVNGRIHLEPGGLAEALGSEAASCVVRAMAREDMPGDRVATGLARVTLEVWSRSEP